MSILEMKGISKSFFGVEVLHEVDFNVEAGEVHALLGENGAGKSTLMNILGGVHKRDAGVITFDGKVLTHTSVQEASDAGIAFVHQELNVINDLKVYENIFLNKEILTKLRKTNKKEMLKRSQELFERLGVDIDPNEMVSNLETSRKQLLEIAKALHSDAKLFILDEPTTALNNQEIEHLFNIIENLKKQGKTFIFISHKIPEVFRISDRYTVFRNGYYIACGDIADTTPEQVTRHMVGEQFENTEVYEERPLGDAVLEIKGLSGPGFADIHLTVREGEVLGLTGLKGAGSSELMQSVFGAAPITSGTVSLWGKPLKSTSIHSAMKNKIGMLPANRKENSVIPDMSLLENEYISEFNLSGMKQHISKKKEVEKYEKLKILLNIKANDYDDSILSLSGGNQQKVILARWLNTDGKILFFDNPTQGIDIGAKAEIYKLIVELSKQGITILINTLEIPEIQKVADRCAIFFHGSIQKILNRNEISEEKVMLYATGTISNH